VAYKKPKRIVAAEKELEELQKWKQATILKAKQADKEHFQRSFGKRKVAKSADEFLSQALDMDERSMKSHAVGEEGGPKILQPVAKSPKPPSEAGTPTSGPTSRKSLTAQNAPRRPYAPRLPAFAVTESGEPKPLAELKRQVEPPGKKLTAEEAEACLERLCELEKKKAEAKHNKRLKILDQLYPPGQRMTKEKEGELIERMYTLGLTKEKNKVDKRLKLLLAPPPGKKMANKEIEEEFVKRMTDGSAIKTQSVMTHLERKYNPKPPTRKLDLVEQQQSCDRLFAQSIEHHKATRERLQGQYLTRPEYPVRSAEELETSSKKLWEGQSVSS